LCISGVVAPGLTRYGIAATEGRGEANGLGAHPGLRDWLGGPGELLARSEYLVAENRMLKARLKGLCVPKIRFCNIGDETRQGQVVM
jgi:hypothetical protein